VVELGTRFKCFKCETKFYDLGRPQPICPACGEDQNNREPRQPLKRKRKRAAIKMEPDIHLIPEEQGILMDHEEHGHEEHEEHEEHDREAMPDLDEEREIDHGEEEDSLEKENPDGDGYDHD
jgi:hypothetical protein